jgi:glyoxylase-like metal-dependent hydrolase (beta-lactamase superfamily II)
MDIKHFFVKGIAHSSYLLASDDLAAVIDPKRDVDDYINTANELGVKITAILVTHNHADFAAGHLELSLKTGAAIYAPKRSRSKFKHIKAAEGLCLNLGSLKIKVLDTPGHTPEHVSYVVSDLSRAKDPIAVFTGDTLFVGDVGRPDLFPGRASELAKALYNSLHKKLLKLPDFTELYPTHGAGSLCGKSIGAKKYSTIGYEKKHNPILKIKNINKFVDAVTTNMPPAPMHFSRLGKMNAEGLKTLSKIKPPRPLPPVEFQSASKKRDTIVLDVRGYPAFGGLHVPGSYHISLAGNFSTFAGSILPPDKKILLLTETEAETKGAILGLQRVGLDKVTGMLKGGMNRWATSNLPCEHLCQMSTNELREIISAKIDITILDVRSPLEFANGHIKGALNIPFPKIAARAKELAPDEPTAVICGTGVRSSMASSILLKHGICNIINVAGGMTAYNNALGKSCSIKR